MFKHFHLRSFHSSSPSLSPLYTSILSTIGSTPIIRLNNILPNSSKSSNGQNSQTGDAQINLYAKLEYFNPLSSVKDRLALAVIEEAERSGELKAGQTVVEATSGNTGIALAMVCAQKKYPLVITMAESFSVERRKIMRLLGAKVILTPAAQKGTGMVKKAQELAKKNGWFQPLQFENEANRRYHAKTTGPEIIQTFTAAGKELDVFVTGYGTGGTFAGVGSVLRVSSPKTKIILCEPANAALISSGQQSNGYATHPSFNPHTIQGWTPDFIPPLTATAVTEKLFDQIQLIPGDEAIATSKKLASKEGIFCGISGGATVYGAIKACEMLAKSGTKKEINVLAMVPDTAERYLSTPLFADIKAEMNEEEMKISKSTPNHQLEA